MCRCISWKSTTSKTHAPRNDYHKAGVILLDAQNRFLLVENYSHKWTFPKGAIEHDENVSEAAARELLEETGITLPPSRLRLFHEYHKQTYYICNAQDLAYDEQLIANKNEITGVGWFCFEHLDELNLARPTAKILKLISEDILAVRAGSKIERPFCAPQIDSAK
jgi:8-oxo-dGTP pyrophosphatase MutT (NUDIX family)